MVKLANPAVFLTFVARAAPWLIGLSAAAGAFGLYGVALAPDDYQQGAAVKIMYVHVPSAWLGMAGWIIMAISALGVLVWRHPLAEVSMKAAAPIGLAFTFLCLATGSLWGRPMWGTWWQWGDARLVSVLVLFVMYLGVIALWRALEDPAQAAKIVAILVLAGAVNIPVIKFSVEWWNTLHQGPSVLRMDGPTIAWPMLWPLLTVAVAATLLFLTLHLLAMRNEILRRRVRTLRLLASAGSR